MSLEFSTIFLYDGRGLCTTAYESGHPDERDTRDLIRADPLLLKTVKAAGENALIVVDHYNFDITLERDELAEESHFALIRAYDSAVAGTRLRPFIDRDDVKHVGHLVFSWPESEAEK